MSLGWVIQAVAQDFGVLLLGRIITGLALGATTVCAPLFLNEMATPGTEGAFGSITQVGISSGILLVNVFGLFAGWRDLAWISACVSGAAGVILMAIVRNPERNRNPSSPRLLKAVDSKAPYIISYTLMFFQQLSGINVVVFFIGPLADIAGFGEPDVISCYTFLVLVVASVVSLFIVDRVGKQVLLLSSSAGMMVSLVMLSTFFFVQDEELIQGSLGEGSTDDVDAKYTGLALAAVFIYIAAFNLGLGPIPWSVVGEYFEPAGFGATTSTVFNWLLAFAVTQSISPILQAVGGGATFAGYAVICFFSCIFSIFFFPRLQRVHRLSINSLAESLHLPSGLEYQPAKKQDVGINYFPDHEKQEG
eukprot:Clim_evm43s55 gene=Clim_evmTU43s55